MKFSQRYNSVMTRPVTSSVSFAIASKLKDYYQLVKFTLSFTVVFSCVVCYLLAPNIVGFNWTMILLLFTAGMLITGSANAINQASEKDTDAMMKRTGKRPVASGRMSQKEANIFALIAGFVGVFIMYSYFNLASALLSAFSLFFYAYIYTPLKKISSLAVLAGALPGALPCLIGWVAATNIISPFATVEGTNISNAAGWALFGIQFFWQFPHFWAIAWVAHNDYTKAGFKLLPGSGAPTAQTALQTVIYALMMIPVGVLPYFFQLCGITSLWIVAAANFFLVVQCVRLYIARDAGAARRVMFSSYIYLPVVLLALLADKNYESFIQ
ncbi:MAG TPA: heme o synthase [Chitinophagaceae bacterium]|nr:heme o synthase [Chitinophagaceae bacterium]